MDDSLEAKELELMNRARELEHEMRKVRQAKVDALLRQYEQQLERDVELQVAKLNENLEAKLESQLNKLEAERG